MFLKKKLVIEIVGAKTVKTVKLKAMFNLRVTPITVLLITTNLADQHIVLHQLFKWMVAAITSAVVILLSFAVVSLLLFVPALLALRIQCFCCFSFCYRVAIILLLPLFRFKCPLHFYGMHWLRCQQSFNSFNF